MEIGQERFDGKFNVWTLYHDRWVILEVLDYEEATAFTMAEAKEASRSKKSSYKVNQ